MLFSRTKVKGLLIGAVGILAIGSKTIKAVDTAPHRLTAVPIQQVAIDDLFWSPKLQIWRDVTVTDCLDKFDRDGAMSNFDHVARGELTAVHGGPEWYDGLTYEMIRAAADFLAESSDPVIEARIDNEISRIAAAADRDPDGYINTYTQMREPTHRWGQNGGNDGQQHDLYNAGCLVDAGVHYYRATGKTTLLAVGVRLANLMCRVMGPPPRQNIIPGHAVGEEAMIGLYQLFKEQPALKTRLAIPVDEDQYLALAKFWIDARGHHEGRTDFGAYDQDDVPVLQQNSIEGHAVRAALMCSGLTALGTATGDTDYTNAAQRLWFSMVGRRMYVTGGVGSDANEEKFGPDYVLPNNGYSETCAAVGSGFFDHNISLSIGDAAAVDALERSLYNGALAGVSLAGNTYFYENPLEAGRNRLRWPWHGCPCCPPMFLKMMASLPEYIYATDSAGDVYVNLFVSSRATINIPSGSMTLTQSTHYPWSGDVKLNLSPQQPTTFRLNIRVPGWCHGGPTTGGLYTAQTIGGADSFTVAIDGQSIPAPEIVRGYATLNREWKPGDTVEIHMNMPVQRVTADPRVEADRGRVALMRGPLVYCMESPDNDGRVRDLFLPDASAITIEDQPDLLGGVVLLHASGRRVRIGGGADDPADITAIPYYANANRGPVSMTTWIPTASTGTVVSTIAGLATTSASHCNRTDSLSALNDGGIPKSSADESRPRFTWWDHRGTSEWVQYDLDKARTVSAVDVYWWDETAVKRDCKVPRNWRLLYRRSDGTWQPVTGKPDFGIRADAFNTVHFDPIETTALKIEAQLQPKWSGGILQWRVSP